jgi:hypothetical protein
LPLSLPPQTRDPSDMAARMTAMTRWSVFKSSSH